MHAAVSSSSIEGLRALENSDVLVRRGYKCGRPGPTRGFQVRAVAKEGALHALPPPVRVIMQGRAAMSDERHCMRLWTPSNPSIIIGSRWPRGRRVVRELCRYSGVMLCFLV